MHKKPGLNPIAVTEMKARMRSAHGYAILTVYLAIVSGIAFVLYAVAALGNPASGATQAGQIGATLFYVIVGLLTVLACFVAPAFTVSAISGERERHSYDLLKGSLLTGRQIAVGKLLPALGYILLMVLATIPLFSLVFLLGGVELAQLAAALCVVVCSALLFITLALCVSSRMPTTLGAATVTYAVVLGLVAGLAVVTILALPALNSLIYGSRAGSGFYPAGTHLLFILFFLLLCLSPVSALVTTEAAFQTGGHILTAAINTTPGAPPILMPAPFLILCAVYLAASALFFWLAIRGIQR